MFDVPPFLFKNSIYSRIVKRLALIRLRILPWFLDLFNWWLWICNRRWTWWWPISYLVRPTRGPDTWAFNIQLMVAGSSPSSRLSWICPTLLGLAFMPWPTPWESTIGPLVDPMSFDRPHGVRHGTLANLLWGLAIGLMALVDPFGDWLPWPLPDLMSFGLVVHWYFRVVLGSMIGSLGFFDLLTCFLT